MGYTVYWQRTTKPFTESFVRDVRKVLNESKEKGICIRGAFGGGCPNISMEAIKFNGDGENSYLTLSHETFALSSTGGKFCNFCKTARKPYDYTVKRVLQVAQEHGIVENVTDDGENAFISDADYIKREYSGELKKEAVAFRVIEMIEHYLSTEIWDGFKYIVVPTEYTIDMNSLLKMHKDKGRYKYIGVKEVYSTITMLKTDSSAAWRYLSSFPKTEEWFLKHKGKNRKLFKNVPR